MASTGTAACPGTATREIEASGGRLDGGGLNSTSRVIAWINIALCVVAVLPVIVGFALLASMGVSTS